MECSCPVAGYCERHKMLKTEHLHKLCRTRPDYREIFDRGSKGRRGLPPSPNRGGAGTELTAAFSSWGFTPTKACKCKQRADEMDRKGTRWCRDNINTIIGWLREEKDRQGMKIPFFDTVARTFVWDAIRKAEQKAAEQTKQNTVRGSA